MFPVGDAICKYVIYVLEQRETLTREQGGIREKSVTRIFIDITAAKRNPYR